MSVWFSAMDWVSTQYSQDSLTDQDNVSTWNEWMNELAINILLFNSTVELNAFDASYFYLRVSKHGQFYLNCYAVTLMDFKALS